MDTNDHGLPVCKYATGNCRLWDQAPIGLVFCDPDGKFVYANPSFCQLVDYAEPELRGRTWMEFTHPEDVSADAQLAKDVKAGALGRYQIIKRYVTKTNNIIRCHLWVMGTYDQGKFVGYVGWVAPVPNGGKYKTTTDEHGEPVARPVIGLKDLIEDNWKSLLLAALTVLGAIGSFIWWFSAQVAEIQHHLHPPGGTP